MVDRDKGYSYSRISEEKLNSISTNQRRGIVYMHDATEELCQEIRLGRPFSLAELDRIAEQDLRVAIQLINEDMKKGSTP